MATSGKPNSPARIGTRSGRLKRSGPDPIKIPELSETLDVADNSLPVENAYEKQRRLRIESNHARMAAFGIKDTAQKLRESCLQAQPKVAKRAPVRRDRVPVADIEPRRSERNNGKKRDYTEVSEQRYRWVEGKPRIKVQKLSREGKVRTVLLKQVFAIQSDYAIGKAVDAAEALVSELETGRAYAKRMEPSNVSGGYWQQLPAAMQTQWRFGTKAKVELECEDVSRQHSAHKKEHGLSTWQYQKGTNEKRWVVVWLPRGGSSAGLSGGWRSFAIDQELTPNDCVVWEVPADVPVGKLPTYIKIHLFRAEDYETEESSRHVITYEEERAKQLKLCETIEEEEEAEEGAGVEEGADEVGPSGEAPEEAGSSQAPAAAQEGKKAAAVARVTRAAKAAPAKEAPAASKADKAVALPGKGAKKSHKANEAAPAKLTRKRKDAAEAVPVRRAKTNKKGAGAAKEAAIEAAPAGPAAAAGKPRANSTRTLEPSAVVEDLAQPGEEKEEEQERLNRLAAEGAASEEEFTVGMILDIRKMKTSDPRFKVRWETFSAEHDTWEPYSMFEDDMFQYTWANKKVRAEAQKSAKVWRK